MNAGSRVLIAAPALVMIGLVAPEAQSRSFMGLGFLAGGAQSAASRDCGDGSVVVGVISAPDRAMLWTPSLVMVDLNTDLRSR